jgi:GR25 family glycosyltransferase involved in LPS biosynthesis
MFDVIDIIYFINLEQRPDRLKEIIGELAKIDAPREKVIHVNAVKHKFGIYGCVLSHITTIEHFIASGKSRCLILEDDFEWTASKEKVYETLNYIFGKYGNIDFLAISGIVHNTIPTADKHIKKPTYLATTSGYIITQKFAPLLLANFKEGAELMLKTINETGTTAVEYSIDTYWYRLQLKHDFLITDPMLGRQRLSYSDITNLSSVTISNIFVRNPDLSMDYLRGLYRDF